MGPRYGSVVLRYFVVRFLIGAFGGLLLVLVGLLH